MAKKDGKKLDTFSIQKVRKLFQTENVCLKNFEKKFGIESSHHKVQEVFDLESNKFTSQKVRKVFAPENSKKMYKKVRKISNQKVQTIFDSES